MDAQGTDATYGFAGLCGRRPPFEDCALGFVTAARAFYAGRPRREVALAERGCAAIIDGDAGPSVGDSRRRGASRALTPSLYSSRAPQSSPFAASSSSSFSSSSSSSSESSLSHGPMRKIKSDDSPLDEPLLARSLAEGASGGGGGINGFGGDSGLGTVLLGAYLSHYSAVTWAAVCLLVALRLCRVLLRRRCGASTTGGGLAACLSGEAGVQRRPWTNGQLRRTRGAG